MILQIICKTKNLTAVKEQLSQSWAHWVFVGLIAVANASHLVSPFEIKTLYRLVKADMK